MLFSSFPGNSRAAAKAKKQVWCVHQFDTLTPRCTRKAGTSPLSLTQELVLSWVIFSPISLCGHMSTMILMKLDFAYRWYLVVQVCKKPPGWQFNAAFVSYGNDVDISPSLENTCRFSFSTQLANVTRKEHLTSDCGAIPKLGWCDWSWCSEHFLISDISL